MRCFNEDTRRRVITAGLVRRKLPRNIENAAPVPPVNIADQQVTVWSFFVFYKSTIQMTTESTTTQFQQQIYVNLSTVKNRAVSV